MSTREFVQRWCQHIQPNQLTKSRYFGGWSNNRLATYLDQCVAAMDASDVPLSAATSEFNPNEFGSSGLSEPVVPDQLLPLPGLSTGTSYWLESY